ncbi:MAG: DEAD/DEAH box helicase, partial [Armatimonadota bacterium]
RAFLDVVRRGFPVAVTNLAVSSNLPLEPGMFDLLIVDEASTCDPASLLPLLYRAKRAVIVGDPHQLPHVTGDGWKQVLPVPTLQGADKREFDAEFGSSAYHLCSNICGAQNTFLLSDHFRCPPPIIAFSNENFYGGALRIHSEDTPSPLSLRLVPGQHRVTPTGSRLNNEQLNEAVEQLVALSKQFDQATIGFVTPYRAMADAAVELAKQHPQLSPLLDQGRLIIGTAHRFQGNEVDFLVFATTAGSNAGKRESSWVEHPNLFNVAITRAKKHLLVIADPVLWQSGALRRTKSLFENPGALRDSLRRSSPELKEVLEQLNALGIKYSSPSSFRGYPLDIIDASDKPRWALVFVGWNELRNLSTGSMIQWWSDRAALAKWGIRLYYATPITWSRTLTRILSDEWLS